MYVCQSVHYLTSLLKIGYQWYLQFWVSYLSQIFWGYSGDICTLVSNDFRYFVVCQSFHYLILLLILVYPWYLQFWIIYLSQIFCRYSCNVCTLVPNNFRFLVCLSVCSLPHSLTKIRLTLDMSSSQWIISLKSSRDHLKMGVH